MKETFKPIKTREEFFTTFLSFCSFAETTFDKAEVFIETYKNQNDPHQMMYVILDLISLTRVISGFRGGKTYFIDESIRPVFIEKDGVIYDQSYLYKVEDYFSHRLLNSMNILKELDQEKYNQCFEFFKN